MSGILFKNMALMIELPMPNMEVTDRGSELPRRHKKMSKIIRTRAQGRQGGMYKGRFNYKTAGKSRCQLHPEALQWSEVLHGPPRGKLWRPVMFALPLCMQPVTGVPEELGEARRTVKTLVNQSLECHKSQESRPDPCSQDRQDPRCCCDVLVTVTCW